MVSLWTWAAVYLYTSILWNLLERVRVVVIFTIESPVLNEQFYSPQDYGKRGSSSVLCSRLSSIDDLEIPRLVFTLEWIKAILRNAIVVALSFENIQDRVISRRGYRSRLHGHIRSTYLSGPCNRTSTSVGLWSLPCPVVSHPRPISTKKSPTSTARK